MNNSFFDINRKTAVYYSCVPKLSQSDNNRLRSKAKLGITIDLMNGHGLGFRLL